jgi:hypothetical protein
MFKDILVVLGEKKGKVRLFLLLPASTRMKRPRASRGAPCLKPWPRDTWRRRRVANMLLSHLPNTSANLMVMVARGHSRLRETMFGGLMRTILGCMTIT